jgi:hypothetical protein
MRKLAIGITGAAALLLAGILAWNAQATAPKVDGKDAVGGKDSPALYFGLGLSSRPTPVAAG